jgi:hypothetical protein
VLALVDDLLAASFTHTARLASVRTYILTHDELTLSQAVAGDVAPGSLHCAHLRSDRVQGQDRGLPPEVRSPPES